MIERLKSSLWAVLVMLDVVLCTIWLVPLHILGLADKPTGRQLISGYVGKASFNGHRWGRVVERMIDSILGAGHCHRAFINGQG